LLASSFLFLCDGIAPEKQNGGKFVVEFHHGAKCNYSFVRVFCILWWKNGGMIRQRDIKCAKTT